MTPEQARNLKKRLRVGCLCQGIRLTRIQKAIEDGARTFAEVAAKTGIGAGSCGGKRCGRKVQELLAARTGTTGEREDDSPS